MNTLTEEKSLVSEDTVRIIASFVTESLGEVTHNINNPHKTKEALEKLQVTIECLCHEINCLHPKCRLN